MHYQCNNGFNNYYFEGCWALGSFMAVIIQLIQYRVLAPKTEYGCLIPVQAAICFVLHLIASASLMASVRKFNNSLGKL